MKMMYKIVITLIQLFVVFTSMYAKHCLWCPGGGGGGGGASTINCSSYENTSTLFVDSSRPNDTGDGKSWETAKKYLYSALSIANACDASSIETIKIAQGVYKPSTVENSDATFFIGKNGIVLQGGYPPGGDPEIIDYTANPTILDGDLGNTIRSHHLVMMYDVYNITFNGIRFRNALADGLGSLEIFEGVFASRKDGGGIFMKKCNNIRFYHCVINNNYAHDDGGGVYSDSCTARFSNVIFADNVTINDGGGIYLQGTSNATFTNCALVKNQYLNGGGGAIYNTTSTTVNLYNTVFWDNTNSWNGGGIRNVYHCLRQDNNTLNGGVSSNNVTQDPLFNNINDLNGPDNTWFTSDDGLHACDGSVLLNRGDNDAPNILPKDLKGAQRVYNQQIDIGPYEHIFIPDISELPFAINDSAANKIYSGYTTLANDCDIILARLWPSGSIDAKIKVVTRKSHDNVNTFNGVHFVNRIYYLENLSSGNDFVGYITLYFKNTEFTAFNNLPYSVKNLPTSTNRGDTTHFRIINFVGSTNVYQPLLNPSADPVVIKPTHFQYDSANDIWKITFRNEGSLGLFLVTSVTEYQFTQSGDFSNTNKWLDGLKPSGILPSFNKITVNAGQICNIDEPLELKPYASLIVMGTNPIKPKINKEGQLSNRSSIHDKNQSIEKNEH
jgi:hypothetical protein